MSAPNYQASDFLTALQNLMPRGLTWPTNQGSVMAQVMGCLTPSYARHTARNNYLLVDAFPATAVELLPEWEAALGLPDPCAGPAPNLQGRQRQVLARFAGVGGQSIPYIISYAGLLGYAITITEYTPFRMGQQQMGQPLGTQDWAFAWTVNAPPVTLAYFRAGHSAADEALETWGNTVLGCELTAIKPAHTVMTIAYVGALLDTSFFLDESRLA